MWLKRMVCTHLQIEIILGLVEKVEDKTGGWEELEFDLPHSSDLRSFADLNNLPD